jgi:putative ABC transport system permease protein
MLPKLALGNVKKSIRDYAIYFITIAFAVCIFYIFNSIESQQAMMEPSPGQAMALKLLGKFMDAFSIFISAALCFLIIYANSFLIKRRKKEFGIYLILGMEKSAISKILVMETALVGIAGLMVGVLMGVLVSQGMALVTARLLNSTISTYHFVFSVAATGKTAAYFGLTFLLTLIFNITTINKQKLITLLQSARKNESFTPPRLMRSVIVFIGALVCIGAAYYLMNLDLFFNNTLVFALAATLLVVGTFLFFFSLSGFFLRLVQQRKGLYLRNLNMFVLRQINSKIHTNYVSMTFVCLMLTLAICALSSGTGIANSIDAQQKANAPFDATVSFQQESGDEERTLIPHVKPDIEKMLREQGVDLNSVAAKWSAISLYQSPVALTMKNADGDSVKVATKVMKLSDYNAVLALHGEQPIKLEPGTYALHADLPSDPWKKALTTYLQEQPALDFNGTRLTTSPSSLYTAMIQTVSTRVEEANIIVPDEYVDKDGVPTLPAVKTLININYREGADRTAASDSTLSTLLSDKVLTGSDGIDLGTRIETRTDTLQVGSSATTIVAYIALYLGMVFLLASAALLAIAQLSEASDNISRYRLLAKIGAEDKMLRGSLLSQVAIYFGAPLLLALAHSLVGITVLCAMFTALKETHILEGSLIAALVLIAIYGGYFLATYSGSRGILNREVLYHLAQK